MYSHNQLYGRWTVNLKTTELKPTGRTLRLELGTDKHVARLWSATDIMLLEPWMLSGHPYLSKLGPDVADIHTETSAIFGQLREEKVSTKTIVSPASRPIISCWCWKLSEVKYCSMHNYLPS